jgi:hypothetical protein
MIELRWKLSFTGEKTLQYRQQYDKTIYAGMATFPETSKEVVWSVWKDVPVETDI